MKTLLTKLQDILLVLFTPTCWIQIYPYSKEWDKRLNLLMQSNRFKIVDDFTAFIGGQEVWIENHPYASFRTDGRSALRLRPKRSTILRARKKLINDSLDRLGIK